MQAEAINEQSVAVTNSWLVSVWWTLATAVVGVLCFPVAESLGLTVVWGVRQTTAGGLPETLITGTIIGLAQALVLRAYLKDQVLWMWPIATAVGLLLGIFLWASATPTVNSLKLDVRLAFAVQGAIEVIGVGLCQGLVLMLHRIRGAAWWLPVTILAGATFWPITTGLSIYVFSPMFQGLEAAILANRISITIAFIVFGAITGLTLALLLRSKLVGAKVEMLSVQDVPPIQP